jgi:hypothetical protein
MSKGRPGTIPAAFRLSGLKETSMASESDASGQGHPLPASDEAHSDALPEHLLREKGTGGDDEQASRATGDAVAPDGESYPTGRDDG